MGQEQEQKVAYNRGQLSRERFQGAFMNDALKGAMDEFDRIKRMVDPFDLHGEALRNAALFGSEAVRGIAASSQFLQSEDALRQAALFGSEAARGIVASSQYIADLSERFRTFVTPPVLDVPNYGWLAVQSRDLVRQQQLLQGHQRGLEQSAAMISSTLSEFNDSWSKLFEQNRAVFSEADVLARNTDLLAGFRQAETDWLRTAQFPSTFTDWTYLTREASGFATHIGELLAVAATHTATSLTDEASEDAFRVAEERFAEILEEKNPRTALHALRDFADQVVAKLPHAVGNLLYHLLLLLLAHLIYGTVIEPRLNWHVTQPTIVKEIRAEAKRIQLPEMIIPYEVRVVIAPRLVVYQRPSRKAHQIGRLYAGDIVYLQKVKTMSWSLVERAAGDSAVKGWILSRYIKALSAGRHSS
jgi:hypothetical protein